METAVKQLLTKAEAGEEKAGISEIASELNLFDVVHQKYQEKSRLMQLGSLR